MADSSGGKISSARGTMETLMEMSKLLNTGLDADQLTVCVRLLGSGVNPEALSMVIQELRRESINIKESEDQQSSGRDSTK